MIIKVKNVPWMFLLMILREKKLMEHFMKKNCKKQIKEFRTEKVIKGKDDKLCVKWKGAIIRLTAG